MRKFAERVVNFLQREDGPTAVEYAVMLALIILVCITAITALGTKITAGMPRKGSRPDRNAWTATSLAAFSTHGAVPPATGALQWQTPSNLSPGTYTYFCRIHPFMRGAFRVKP